MIDTLMVLWTRGLFSRFLRAFFTFLMLFAGICVMLFLVTASGVRLPGLAVTIAPPDLASSSAGARPTSTPVLAPYTIPIILQNPKVPRAAQAPTLLQTPEAAYPLQRSPRRPGGNHRPVPTPTQTGESTPAPFPIVIPTPDGQSDG